MRCFKIFFKHTWHPQQMDNPNRLGSPPSKQCTNNISQHIHETELGELRTVVNAPEITDAPALAAAGVPCYNGACKSSKPRAEHRLESPWHHLKTLFLVFMIIALIVWIVVYVLLSQYGLL